MAAQSVFDRLPELLAPRVEAAIAGADLVVAIHEGTARRAAVAGVDPGRIALVSDLALAGARGAAAAADERRRA